ncbi:MAG: hypothetical protein KC438_04030, partial [Thermomicrobiales bacterium]|nr:hypothetical protein [Thermomicrobiales bacterium]
MKQVALGQTLALRLLIASVAVLATMHTFGAAPPLAAQGTATIEIINTDADTGLPAPFTRFQVTSENGTPYGPLETDLNGYVAFSVTVDPQGTSFTVEEETPPACAAVPEPQTTEPLHAGDATTVTFTTQDNPGCGLGTIALYAMSCPEGFNGPADDYGPWRDGCLGNADGTGFTITSVASGQQWTPTAGAYGIPGRAPIVGLPAGEYTFQQQGAVPATVFCLVYDTSNYVTSPQPSSVVPISLVDGVGSIALDGNRVSCDLFTAPGGGAVVQSAEPIEVAEPTALSSLEVHLASCPDGYPNDASIFDACHDNGIDGRQVSLFATAGGAYAENPVTVVENTPGPGIARFGDVPVGRYALDLFVAPGVEIVANCTGAEGNPFDAEVDPSTQVVFLDIGVGETITCDIYEVSTGTIPSIGSSSLELHALLCPAGTDPDGDLYGECHGNGVDGAFYEVTGPDGYVADRLTTIPVSPGPGVATFGELSGGAYTISQATIQPNANVIVYCSLADADDAVPFVYVDGGTISLELPADTGVVCDWYTIPVPDVSTTTLQVDVYRCPTNFSADENTPLEVFQDLCGPSTGTTQFSLTPDGGEPIVQIEGSAGVGTVLFPPLPTNSYLLHSSIPGDFNDAYIFCGVQGAGLSYTGHNGVRLDIDASQGPYVCQWFNDPYIARGEFETINVTNYLCPPGTDGAFAERCASSPLAGATLRLEWRAEELVATTDVNGVASLSGMLPGENVLTNVPPAGTNVAVYVVECEATGEPFGFTYNDQHGMSIELDLPAGVVVDCAWYNIPPATPSVTPAGEHGSITVHTFLCQGKSIDAYNWEEDCAAETVPAGFALK